MRTFVLGDVHGARRALVQCLSRSGFDSSKDRLIVLGDVCDGWPEVRESVEQLLALRHCEYILGNHDYWALQWAASGQGKAEWLSQGGQNTVRSYEGQMPAEHVRFFQAARYYLEEDGRVFVHGGFNPEKPLREQNAEIFLWDRDLFMSAIHLHRSEPTYRFGGYSEIYIGHTPTLNMGRLEPVRVCNVWALDTGAGWSGKLTILEVGSGRYWQSDIVSALYPGERGR